MNVFEIDCMQRKKKQNRKYVRKGEKFRRIYKRMRKNQAKIICFRNFAKKTILKIEENAIKEKSLLIHCYFFGNLLICFCSV